MAERPREMRSWAAGVLVVLGLFALLEGAARIYEIWRPSRVVDVGLGFDPRSRVFISDPQHPERRETAKEKAVAFRWQEFLVPKPARTWRVFAVGESSVYNLADELPGLAQRLARKRGRPVELLNAGGASYGSQRLVAVVREILEYQPDLVLLYLGHNEFEELEQLELAPVRLVGLMRAVSHLALFRVLRDAITRVHVRRLEEQNRRVLARQAPDWARAWAHRFTPMEAAERMRAFERNLTNMVELVRAAGVKVVMGTIPSNRWAPVLFDSGAVKAELERLHAESRFAEADARARAALREASSRHQSSDLENEIVRAIAARYELPLADVERAIMSAEPHGIPGETLFNDQCHLNARGNAIWAQTYERVIDQLP